MVKSKRSLAAIAVFSILAVVLAACGGSSGSSGSPKSTDTTKSGGSVPKTDAASGTLTVGAEQDAACADWDKWSFTSAKDGADRPSRLL